MFVALTVLAASILAFLVAMWRSVSRKPSGPGPKRHFLLGNVPDYMAHQYDFLDFISTLPKAYGSTWCIQFPFQPEWICVSRPEEVEYILKTNFENYEKGRHFSSRFYDLLGRGIFNVDGELWRSQRKISSHIFSVSNFRDNMLVVFNHHCHTLQQIVQERGVEKGAVLDMHDLFHRFTLDSIGEIAFGVAVGSLHGDVAFQKAFDAAQEQCFLRFLRPGWRIHPSELWHLRNTRIVHEFADTIVAARKKQIKEGGGEGRNDLLSMFMTTGSKSGGVEMDDLYLRDVITNFVIAGRDTTAQALSWGLWLIAQNPHVEAALIKEVDEEFVRKANGVFTLEVARSMIYTTALLYEVLRLYPSVPKDGAYAVKDDVLPDGTPVPAGSFVVFVPYSMGRNELLWERPMEFDPTRFIAEDGHSIIKVSPFKYCAFKAGPRTCLGQNMAFIEATCVLATLYSKYRFEMAPDAPRVTYVNSTTLPMANGLKMRALKRV